MAVAFLVSVLTSILKRLPTCIAKAFSSSSTEPPISAEEELQMLERIMRRIHAVLKDAEEKGINDRSEQLYLLELKEAAYDAEDAVDEYEYEVLHAQVEALRRARATHMGDKYDKVTLDFNSYHPKVPISDELASRVKDIRKRFEEITDCRRRLTLRDQDGKRRCIRNSTPGETASLIYQSQTFGREDEKEKIIDWLLQEQEESNCPSVSVLCIVGMGGLGKTTLAQMVYNDPRVCQYFQLRGWIYVSHDFDLTSLAKKVHNSFDTHKIVNDMSLDELSRALKVALDGKRFILVLDDVWNLTAELWSSFKTLFVGVGAGKILVTTQDDHVCKIMQTTPPIYLRHLSFDDSWSLFKNIAFKFQDHDLLEIGKKIVLKCGGLPLAIKVLAGILYYEDEKEAWVDVLKSELWEIGQGNDVIFPTLKISYDHLPVELRQCFKYLCLFPKGSFLSKSTIVQQWKSHGFIQPNRKKREEDVGNDYCNELLHRSFLQYHGDNFLFDETFGMHDLIHDLARFVAKDEHLVMTTLKSGQIIPKTIRHVAIHVKDKSEIINLEPLCKAKHLKTLILSIHGGISVMDLLPNLGRLRTLVLPWCNSEDLSDAIASMKHLRYLEIGGNSVPASVHNLHHLHTLKFTKRQG